jgi:hypothetical protein
MNVFLQITAREIDDNLKLKSTQKDIQNVENKIQTVEDKLRQYGDQRSLNR